MRNDDPAFPRFRVNPASPTPRALSIELDALPLPLDRVRAPWADTDPPLERVGRWSGSALAAACSLAALRDGRAVPFVLATGDAVRRGLPTAARATVAAVGPLTGLYAEGQVGGELGPRLARVGDALLLHGRAPESPAPLVLVVSEEAVELVAVPELAGAEPGAAAALVARRVGPCALLRIGPAATRGVRFASLAAGGELPSFVGRGGLGAALAARGLAGVAITARPVEERDDAELARWLASSPRLVARSDGGTLELWHAFAARGDLRARNYRDALPADSGAELSRASREAGVERRGCRGCPTPCGWVFEAPGASAAGRQTAHFGAAYALGPNLGLSQAHGLALLAACDRAGMDAREAGAVLALRCLARERGIAVGPRWGRRAELEGALAELAGGGLGAGGAEALASELGLEDELFSAKGQAARPESDPAVVLGQCVATGGSDPMRVFPFVADHGPVPAVNEPPGRRVWWHENFAAAVDATGFCAFSAGGLLADGACTLSELARRIAPDAIAEGDAFVAAGASIVLVRRELNRRLGASRTRMHPVGRVRSSNGRTRSRPTERIAVSAWTGRPSPRPGRGWRRSSWRAR